MYTCKSQSQAREALKMQQLDPSAADSDAYEDDPYAELDAIAEQQQREEYEFYASQVASQQLPRTAKPSQQTRKDKREGRKLRSKKRLNRSSGVTANGSDNGSDDSATAAAAAAGSEDSSSGEHDGSCSDTGSGSRASQQQQDEAAKK
jgi:hypothetical protein